jgi:hypothetical protein
VATTPAPTQPLVLYRYRRHPPALTYGVVAAGALLISAFVVPTVLWAILLVVAAAGSVALGVAGRRRWWIEEQTVTDYGVALTRPDGLVVEIPHNRLVSATTKSHSVRFVRDDGALLIFARNADGERILRALEEAAPAVLRNRVIEPPACTSCRPQW